MTERSKFALEFERRWRAQRGRVNEAELWRIFGVSRQTGYVWINRFLEANRDVRALADRPRRPLSSPSAVSAEMQDFIVAMRKEKPRPFACRFRGSARALNQNSGLKSELLIDVRTVPNDGEVGSVSSTSIVGPK